MPYAIINLETGITVDVVENYTIEKRTIQEATHCQVFNGTRLELLRACKKAGINANMRARKAA